MECAEHMQRTESIGSMENMSMESNKRNESTEIVGVIGDHFNTSAEGMKDQPDISTEGLANQLGNSVENMVDQLNMSQPVRYEPNFHEEIIHREFDTFLDNSPNKLVSMDVSPNVEISSQHLDSPLGDSPSEPLPTTINPAELSRGIYESCDVGQNTHVAVVYSASKGAKDSILKDPQVRHVSPYDTKKKGGAKRRRGTKRR
jgi:hypothetical protein